MTETTVAQSQTTRSLIPMAPQRLTHTVTHMTVHTTRRQIMMRASKGSMRPAAKLVHEHGVVFAPRRV